MVGCVVTGSDGQRIVRTFCGYDLHLLFILQIERRPFLTGQCQTVKFHFSLACGLQDKLSVIAFARQADGELIIFVHTLDVHVCTIDDYIHAVFGILLYLRFCTIITDGDILCITHTGHHQGQYP